MSRHKDRLKYAHYPRSRSDHTGMFKTRNNKIMSPSTYEYNAGETTDNEKPELQPPSVTVYIKEDPNCATVVIKSLNNFMTPKELCEQFGAAVVQDYAEAENWMHKCEFKDYHGECLNCNLFVPTVKVCVVDTIYSYREGLELTKPEYSEMIEQMATAHKTLGRIVAEYQNLAIQKVDL